MTANSELVTKDFLYYWYSTFLEKWSQKMLIFGVKSSFLELGILAVQKRELIIEEVHILIQMPIFLGLLKLFVDKCVRRHIVGGANRTLFSVDLPPRLCRTGT